MPTNSVNNSNSPVNVAEYYKDEIAKARATDKGTKIVKPGEDMDKNAFLKILSAELKNQDPSNAKDGTEFVAQMAQFASLEQMSNLNANTAFGNASSLVGKTIALDGTDAQGNQYGGVVKGVFKQNGETRLNVQLLNGELKDFSFDKLSDIIDIPDYRLDYINNNTSFLLATSLMGKQVEAYSAKDERTYSGTVKNVFKDKEGTKLTLSWQENEQEVTKTIPYESVSKVE